MRSQLLLPTLGLLWALGACTSSSNLLVGDRTTALVTDTSQTCDLGSPPLEPMAAPNNTPVFEQFNFRSEAIEIDADTVTFKTPYYDFTLCKGDRTWSIASPMMSVRAENSAPEVDVNYEQGLAKIANLDYSTIDVDGEIYKYRVRLQTNWLNEQLVPFGEPPFDPQLDSERSGRDATTRDATNREAAEEAVYFELRLPDGRLLSERLYTITDLQTAQLGASLGNPEIAGAVAIEDQIWFATTASQGEGESGFASLIHYDLDTSELAVQQPDEMQGNQITAIAATANNNDLTLWLGTKISGEGNPRLPADGLVAYQLGTQTLTSYSVENSPLISAIPYQVAVEDDDLWVATGEGVCQVEWETADSDQSWNCWRFAATAELPPASVDLYSSFLSTEPVTTLTQESVEVLWASENAGESGESIAMRYEVAYEPGFKIQIPQGGYRLTNQVVRKTTKGNSVFWPGHAWHWQGDRFTRSLDEVAVNAFGGGPRGLVASSERSDLSRGFSVDNNAIRGDFDLLEITSDSTQVHYYSGWIESNDLLVYPTVLPARSLTKPKPNPLTRMAVDLPDSSGP